MDAECRLDAYISRYGDFCANDNSDDDTIDYFTPCACTRGKNCWNLWPFYGGKALLGKQLLIVQLSHLTSGDENHLCGASLRAKVKFLSFFESTQA